MTCPNCGEPIVAFAVPADFGTYAPGDGDHAAICTSCLTVTEADSGSSDPDFSLVTEDFPEGETGVAMALAVGLIVDSVARNRAAIGDLFERVQDEGVDPWLVLERLSVAGAIDPDADLERARRQLDQLLR